MKFNKTSIFFISLIVFLLFITTFLSIFIGPILLGFLTAYLLSPILIRLDKKGVSRNLSASISLCLILIIITTIVWVIVPIVIAQVRTIIVHIPDFRDYVDQILLPKIQTFLTQFNGKSTPKFSSHTAIPFNYEKISNALLSGVGESTKFILSSLIFVISTPIFMFIFMKHLSAFYSFVYSLIPASSRVSAVTFFKEVNLKLRAVLRGQVLVVLVLSFIYPIAFLIAGLPTAIGIGVLVGIARLISGLDTIVAFTLGSIVLTVNGSSLKVVFSSIIAFIIVQSLDAFVINPRIMGRFAGLHPLLILVSVISFGYWFGIYGVLLAIPVVTILKVASQKMILAYKKTDFFKK